MKIEDKNSAWDCCHKSENGKINPIWRLTHKRARFAWKRVLFRCEYESLVKRI